MRRIALASLVALITFTAVNVSAALIARGDITSDVTWGPSDGTIEVRGEVWVKEGATLTILPGTNLHGYVSWSDTDYSGFGWNINVVGTGAIYAVGTETDTIDFNLVRIEFKELLRDDANLIEFCKFTNGGGHAAIEFRNTGAIEATHIYTPEDSLSHVTIRNCAFYQGSYTHIYVTSGGSPTIEGCYFEEAQVAIFAHGADTLTVRNCRIRKASCGIIMASLGQKLANVFEPAVCYVDHCTITELDETRGAPSSLHITKGMGICTINDPGLLVVTNSIFTELTGAGIRDWCIEDANYPVNWDVQNDYNMFYMTGWDGTHMFDQGAHSQDVNPQIGSAPLYALATTSPARDAASDGTHIGSWQAAGTPIHAPARTLSASNVYNLTVTMGTDGVVFAVSEALSGNLVIYNAAGTEVAHIALHNQSNAAWHGAVGAGVYYVQLTTGSAVTVQQFITL